MVQKRSNNPINKRHRKQVSFKKAFNTRKLIVKAKMCGADLICSETELTNKINFVRMRRNAAKIIIGSFHVK